MPGLGSLFSYERKNLSYDMKAGLSVAAVALPVSIAYAELTGVGAIAGLYSTILPLIAYALFGSSRQLIIGPDTATCAVIAAVVTPLAFGDPVLRWQLVIIMTLMIGGWCILASRLHLGALADLLSRPILIGLLNGISFTIIIDQIGKASGFKFEASGFIERLIELPMMMITSAHVNTVLVSLATLVILIVIKKFKSRWPAPLIAVVIMTFCSWLINFESYDISIIGHITSEGLPLSSWNSFEIGLSRELVVPSINIAVICFVSMMITARSFAAKNNYDIDANVEFRALGIANIVAGLSQGFVVSGTSSRTAVNDANGGKTQLVSIIAAVIIGIVVIFLLSPLQFIPVCVLGIVLIYSSWSLIDLKSIFQLRNRNRDAFYLSLVTLLAVLIIGIIPGMGLAVLLGLLLFLRTVFRPSEQLLGVDGAGLIHTIKMDVNPIPNVMIYRFNSPLTYFNIAYFKRRVLTLIDESPTPIKWVIVDAVPSFTYPDVSVLSGVEELIRAFKVRDAVLVLAGRKGTLERWFSDMHIDLDKNHLELVSDLYLAVRMIQSKDQMDDGSGSSSSS
ncbi:SulP family inorganic anion transporter [Zophobihabitans entericus]|uniref:SulP family inorganic anion transporter n=2 Tax=Zophobihabitans entericus TaxID=1635327 RepID=A0A6G9IFE2_9GAMM|nr:SulP family inorganic anion transporter [Zophobihabitans entericus]